MASKIKQFKSFEDLFISNFEMDYYSLSYSELAYNLQKIGVRVRKFKNLELKAS